MERGGVERGAGKETRASGWVRGTRGGDGFLLEWPPSLPQALPQAGGTLVQGFLPSASTGAPTSFPKAAVFSLEATWADHSAWGQGTGCADPSGPLEKPVW